MGLLSRRSIACATILSSVLAGCGLFPESCFDLSPTSRLPHWFTLPNDMRRENVTVEMCYFVGSSGSTATFAMRNAKTRATLTNLTGAVRDPYPLNANGRPNEYPSYEVITVSGITEVVEHRRMEPVFYVSDDSSVRRWLGVNK